MENLIINLLTENKELGIAEIAQALNVGIHNVRDILHDNAAFSQDAKSFRWTLTNKAKKEGVKMAKKEKETTENVVETKTTNELEETMKKQGKNPETPIVNKINLIIENLESGKKTETLKKAVKAIRDIGYFGKAEFRTKKEFIEKAQELIRRLNDKDHEPTETEKAVKKVEKETPENPSFETICDFFKNNLLSVIDRCQMDTLKSAKNYLVSVMNEEAYVKGFDDVRGHLADALNERTKKTFEEGVKMAIGVLHVGSSDNAPEEKETVENAPKNVIKGAFEKASNVIETPSGYIPIPENVTNVIKTISRIERMVDTQGNTTKALNELFVTSLNAMASEINGLKKVIEAQNKTIDILGRNIKNFDVLTPVVPVSVVVENNGKVSNEIINETKTKAQIQAENRLTYINGLKGIDKELFKYITGKNGNALTVIDIAFAHEDNTPKEIKTCLVRLIKAGLIEKFKSGKEQVFKAAKISAFTGKVKKEAVKDTKVKKTAKKDTKKASDKKEAKKTMKRGKKAKGNGYKTIVSNALNSGKKYSMVQLVKMIQKERPEIDDKAAKKNASAAIYFIKKDGVKVEKKAGKYFIK